jgi:hypothetical protein
MGVHWRADQARDSRELTAPFSQRDTPGEWGRFIFALSGFVLLGETGSGYDPGLVLY